MQTAAKFLRQGDATPRIQLHLRVICGFEDASEDLDLVTMQFYDDARKRQRARSRVPLLPDEKLGGKKLTASIQLDEISRAFSVGNEIRWEYHTDANRCFYAIMDPLADAVFLEWGFGLDEYDWKKTKAYEVHQIISDPVNRFYSDLMRADDLLMYGSAFQIAQSSNASPSLQGATTSIRSPFWGSCQTTASFASPM